MLGKLPFAKVKRMPGGPDMLWLRLVPMWLRSVGIPSIPVVVAFLRLLNGGREFFLQ